MIILGDSKSLPAHAWTSNLPAALAAKTGVPVGVQNGAGAGQSIAIALTVIDATLAGFQADNGGTTNYRNVLLNWGVNDMGGGLPPEATWEANYLTIIDKIHTKAPNAKVYLMRPWQRGYDADAATLNGWIATIVAARAFTYVGPDEAVWLKGSDNGYTYTSDGTHQSAAGEVLEVSQWQTVLGY